jgi:hypothetical protein
VNFLNKKLLLAAALLSCGGSIFGYVWTFTNLTLKPVLIEFRLLAYGRIYYDIVNPGENSTRFEWPMGSMKAGFCVDKFFIGELNDSHLISLFGEATFPTADQIAAITEDSIGRFKLARIGKSEPEIRWVSGKKWGTFDTVSKKAVEILTTSVGDVAGQATNVLAGAGAEVATGGATAGAAGAATAKLNIGRLFTALGKMPGAIMTLAHKSPCASRHFDIVKDEEENALVVVTKD